jgi:DNA-binding response OmpR family regulator
VNVLIVEPNLSLAQLWQRHLERKGAQVQVACTQEAAISALSGVPLSVIILDLDIDSGSALAISDLAELRQPQARVIFVTASRFFSDGSIFRFCANACAYLPRHTAPDDLALMAQHYAESA